MTESTAAPSLSAQFRQFSRAFWMVNVMETLERLAYYGVRVVIPIYIAQADEVNGLHFTQGQKATIFAWWALFQTLVPMFSGGFADRYGYKRTIAGSIAIKMAGYLLMATQRSYAGFFLGCCVLATGTAIFKPGVQGTLVRSITRQNSSVAWGIFYMVVNIGGWLGPPLAHYLKGMGWPAVFYGCAAIVSLNYLTLLTYDEVPSGASQTASPLEVLRQTLRNVAQPRLLVFILIMSGFWLGFMPLYDLLPNFIVDWTDSTSLAASLPAWAQGQLTEPTARGVQVSQEWMINLDAGLIVLLMIPISAMAARMRRLASIFLGTSVCAAGLLLAGISMSGAVCLAGIGVFAVGEMLASPRMNEYLGIIAPADQKGLYMGYANIPIAVGWFLSSKISGFLYELQGEKAGLALRYLSEHALTPGPAPGRSDAVGHLAAALHQTPAEVTRTLWDAYHPYQVWFPLAGILVASAIGMVFYARAATRWTTENA